VEELLSFPERQSLLGASRHHGGGFAVAFLAAFAASWLSVWLNDLLLWVRRKSARR
jgi:hypothetical protein